MDELNVCHVTFCFQEEFDTKLVLVLFCGRFGEETLASINLSPVLNVQNL